MPCNPRVGLLLADFEKPERPRPTGFLQGLSNVSSPSCQQIPGPPVLRPVRQHHRPEEELMSNVNLKRIGAVAAISAAWVLLGGMPTTAQARDGAQASRQARPAHAGTGSWTRGSQVQRTENGYVRQDRWQHQDGRSASRDVVVTNDRDAGQRSRRAEWSGPDGRQGQVDTVSQRTDDGFTRSTIATRSDGATATREMTVERDREAGTRSTGIERTGFDGRTSSSSSLTQRTDDGYQRDVTQVLPGGETRTRSIDVSCDAGSKSCTKTVDRNGGAGSE